MTYEQQVITDMGQLSDLSYLGYGTTVKIGDHYYGKTNMVDDNGHSVTYDFNFGYTVIDMISTSNSMQALLLKKDDGTFIIAFRGTQEPLDWLVDVTTGMLNFNPQITDAMTFVQKALDNPDYNISTSNLTLTGHSLGGILTQSVGATKQIPGYAFNTWSSSNLIDYVNIPDPLGVVHHIYEQMFNGNADQIAYAMSHIQNFSYVDSGMLNGDILSNGASNLLGLNQHLGSVTQLYGQDLGLGAHSMAQVNNVISVYNEILSRFTSDTTYKTLTDAYLVNQSMGYFFSDNAVISKDMYDTTNQYFLSEANIFEAGESTLRFNFLNDLSAFQIEQQAKIDNAVLFALIKLNGFAVEGSLSSYSSLNRADYSSLYIEDRSLLLYHMLDPNKRPLGDLYIKERAYGITVGGDGWNYDNPQIIFGYDGVTAAPEELIGGIKADHLFGMGGDDLLIGDEGDDYLEGGQGNDKLSGGKDYDTYISGDGDTIYDSDGKGEVFFEGFQLSGGIFQSESGGFKTYEGDGGLYILESDGTLRFAKNGNFLTINNYHKENNDLGIILQDEDLELTVIGYMANENDGTVSGKVVLTKAYSKDIIVQLSTLDDTAHAGEDYTAKNDITVTIAAGETEGEFSVDLIDDQIVEGRETFFAQIDSVTDISNQPIQYTIKDIQSLTIEDDDGLNVSVFAPSVSESDGVATGAVTINKTYDTDLTITLYTQDDSAVAGGSYPDYVENNAITVTIAAGSTYGEFNVEIVNDDRPESTENFYSLVQSVVDSSGTAVDYTLVEAQPFTIEDDDGGTDNDGGGDNDEDTNNPVMVNVSDAILSEDGGSMIFTVSLSNKFNESISLKESISIDLVTVDGSAVLGDDYIPSSNFSVAIAAGSTSTTYAVPIKNDEIPEPTETFTLAPYSVVYTGSEQILLSNVGTGTIIDDDNKTVDVSVFSPVVSEDAGVATGAVTISKTYDKDLTITLYTQDDSAVAGGSYPDYVGNNAITVTIAAGTTYAEFNVGIVNDDIPEDTEEFYVLVESVTDSTGTAVDFTLIDVQPFVIEDNDKKVVVTIDDATAMEAAESMSFKVSIDTALDKDITIDTTEGSVTIVAGQKSGSVIHTWKNDYIQECYDEVFTVKVTGYTYPDELNVIHTDTAIGTIKDDDPEGQCPHPVKPCFPNIPLPTPTISYVGGNSGGVSYGGSGGGSSYHYSGGGGTSYTPAPSTPHTSPTPPAQPKYVCVYSPNWNSGGVGGGGGGTSPIVLDLNRNGITSISLAASIALFDYDGDGIKENTAWIEGGDALLVNDANNDGIINDATELFGNYTKNADGSIAKSGYQALSYYDTNSDGVINATDTRFGELKLWIDGNGDGVTDTGELKSLTEMGVTSLSLNSATPYIPTTENTNTIIQETTFTDAQGEGVMRDVLFRYENNSTNTEGVYFDMDGNGIKEKMLTWTDPNQWMIVKDLNGDGKITSGREVVGNHMILSTGTTAADTIQALKTFDINHDGVVDAADNSGLAFWTDRNHNGLTDVGELEALGAAGSIQTIKLNPYQTLLSGYDGNHDGVINSSDALYNNLYIQTNSDENVTLYLPDNASARAMIAGYTGGESIQTSEGEKIIKTVLFYSGTSMSLNEELEGIDASETLQGSSRSETLRGMGGRDILDAGAGDDILEGGSGSDKLMGGAGNDTYLYSRGDGKDLIIDTAGSDTIRFSAGITRDDIIIKSNGADISIYLKDGTKPLSELTDQIIIKEWHTTSTVKTITFSDGSSMDGRDILTRFATDTNDTIYGTDNSEALSGGEGNDVLQGRGGNDTYLYGRGDGRDVIIDSGGNDTLKLGEGIGADDLIIKVSADSNDLMIALKEEGKTFSELTDTITMKDWFTSNNRIETVTFSDGSTIDTALLIPLQGTNENDTTHLLDTASSITLDLQGGDDVVTTGSGNDMLIGGEGNDTLQGGAGDDTYVFNRGDGADTISDTGGTDTLKLGEGISADDLIIQKSGNDVIVALKEEGVGFSALKDKVTLQNWDNVNNNIENIILSDGTMIDTAFLLNPIPQDEQAMKFDGLDDVLIISNPQDFNVTTGLTLTSTFSYNGMGTGYQSNSYGMIVSKHYTNNARSYDIGIDVNGKITFQLIDANNIGYSVQSHTLLNTGQMYDVTATYDKATGISRIYINGVLDNEVRVGSFNIMQSSEPLRIGAYGNGGTATRTYFNGTISDVQIYNKALSETEVAIIADGGVGSDALLAHYDFEGSAPLEDKSGNGHTASIQGNPTIVNLTELSAPIVFDLNGNGVTSTSTQSNNVYFDYNGSGLRERTGWIERGDALLAVDVNKDGVINDGSELFGDHTKLSDGSLAADGYAAMAQYDTNSDGKIDSSDAHFNDLLLWSDTNLDGQSSADELSTLAANGIKSIDLSSNPLDASENGNRISYETSFTTTNGTNGIVRDLWFKTASNDTIASQNGDIADAGSFSDSFDDFTTDTNLKIDAIESMRDSGISSLTLQSRYTGSGLDGASAQTVFEGVGYTGTLSNVWLKSDTLDTQYTYTGTLSDEVKALPSIDGQGNVINLQEAMNEKSELATSVSEFQSLSETGNLADFEANIDSIIEGWALYDLGGESANSTPPIVLDLNGNGITSQSLASSGAYFDYDGDGRREHTAWADAGDALLAIDLDGDGIITHGAELFGNYTLKADGSKATDGYDAMAQYDTNGDNVLDASDAEFSRLRLWKDLNQNGKNDVGELSTLAQERISALHLSRTDGTTFTQIIEAGNTITQETNYTGSANGAIRDVWFSYDGTDTIAYSNLSDSDEKKIAIVENFYGKRLNSEERNSVEVIAEVLNQYNALRYDTIAKIITDKLYGEGFPNCQFLHDALNNTLGRIVGGAASTTETLLAVNLLAALLKREHVGVLADIYPEYFSNPTIAGLLAQSNIAIGFENGALVGHIGNRTFGTSSAEELDFSTLDGVRAYMSGGDDTIIGSHGIDELVGGEGDDTLNGNGGNNVLEGGQGDDTLIGSSGQNVYRYAWGDGNDTIIDAGSEEYAPDTLRLSDLDISRVSIERVGDDMILHVRNEEGELLTPFDEAFGTITIKDGYTEGKIEHFYFKESRYTFDEVLAYVPADTDYYFVQGDAHVTVDEKGGEDTLHFGDGITPEGIIARIVGENLIIGLAQEGRTFDTLTDKITILNYSGAIEQFTFQDGTTMDLDAMIELAQAHLMINGSDASDTLYGTAESEIFDGRVGDDTIYGEAGDDTYKFGLGDGHDTIIDTAGDDTILLKEGISADDVTLSLDGDDLILSLSDGSRIRIVSWMNTEGRIEHIKDIQGTSVDFSSIFKPIVENATAEGNEDNLIEGSLSVTDMSGTSLVYAVATNATNAMNGTFEINTDSGEWTYEPNANFNGDDSVVVSVTNGYGVTTTSTIALNILSVNDAPSVDEENITVTLDHTLNVEGQVTANDVDGDTLSYTIETQASHGTLSVDENGKWTYSAVDGYKGEDIAVLSISDGNGGIVLQLLNFNTNVNMPPEALAEFTNTLQDIRVLSGEVGATDVDGDVLTYIVSTAASHGILSVDENGTWNYAAADGYMGSDSAVITIDDGNGGIITQTLNFEVKVSAPTLFNTTSNLLEDTSTMGTLSVDNPIGGALIYEILNTSTKGDFILNESGEWSYAPSENLNGDDSVTIKVTNTYGLSTTATFNLAIEAVNDIPVIFADELYTLKDIRIMNGTIEAHDVDEDVLTYAISTEASHGIFTIDENGDWNYEAEDGYMGTDSAVITVDDGNGGVVTQTLNFEVKVSVPTLSDSIINILEDSSTTGIFSVENPIGGALFYEVLGSSSKGDFTVNEDGEWSYAPNANLNGEDSVTIKVTNEYGLSTTSTVSFAIEAVNDAPVLVEAPDTITLYAGASTTGSIQATDIDGDTLSYSVTTPDHGRLSINENGEWNYTAEPYHVGQSSATVTVDDGNGGSVVATLNFTNLMTPDWQYSYAGETLTIEDNDGTDTVMMNTVSMNELTFIQEGNNLRIDIKDQPDVILTDYFAAPANGVESIQTSEGNINLSKEKIGTSGSFINIGWGGNQNDLISANAKNSYVSGGKGDDILFGNERNNTFLGDVGNDLLVGGEGNDTLYGGENDDILYGDNGNDTLSGDEGNDKLFGGKGNDTLLGGNGNDFLAGGEDINTLSGGSGDDIYLVTKGNNKTTIDENVSTFSLFGRWFGQNGGEDILKFGEGITKEDISFLMKGNDLLLQYGDNEFITINNQKSEANRIEKFELNDGSYLTNTDIDRIIQQLSAYSKDQGFHIKDNTQIQSNQALMNIVAAGWHAL